MISTAVALSLEGVIIAAIAVRLAYLARKRPAVPPPLPARRPWKQALPVGHPDLRYRLPLADWQAWKALEQHLEEVRSGER